MTMNIVEIRRNLSDALNRVAYRGERVILERRGKEVAVLVSMEDLALLEELEDKADVEAARKARAEGGKPIPLEEVAKRLGIKLPRKRRQRRSR